MKTTHTLLAVTLSACLCSCIVDRDLDLSKEYEDKLTVVPGLSAPIQAETKLFTIDGILDLALKGQEAINGILPIGTFFEFDDNGNFCTPFGSGEYEVTVFPGGSIGSVSTFGTPVDLDLPLSSGWSSASFKIESDYILNFSANGIDAFVEKVRNIKIKSAPVSLRYMFMSQPFTTAKVKAGSTITLPEWMQVSTSAPGLIAGADGHTLIFSEPMVFSGSTLTINFTLEAIKGTEEGITCTYGDLDFDAGSMKTALDISFDKTDTSLSDETESSFMVAMYFSSSTIYLTEADCLLAPVIPFNNGGFDINTGISSMIDFAFKPSSLTMDVNVTNLTAGPFSLSGEFTAKDDEGNPIGSPVVFGDGAGAIPVEVGPGDSRTIHFSDSDAPAGSIQVPVTEINNALIDQTFSSASLNGLSFRTSHDWVHIDASNSTTLAKVEFKALGAFSISDGLDTQADITVGHFGVDTTFSLDSYSPAFIDLIVDSSIPMGIDLRCTFVDKNGEEVKDYAPVVSSSIAPGTTFTPRESVITIGFQTDRIVPFESLRLQLLLDFSAYKSFPLNKNQGLTFKRIVIRAPEGVTLDPDWLEYLKYLNSILTLVDGAEKLFFN